MTEEPHEEEPREPHDPTGLDLAARIARATAMSTRYGVSLPEPKEAPKSRPRASRGPREEQRSGPRPDDRDPQLIGVVFDKVVARRGWAKRLSLSTVLRNWSGLVGESNAAHSQPVDFRDGVLKVQCDTTAWATGMRYSASQLVAKLNRELGDQTVRRVDIVGPAQKSWKHGPRSVRDGRGPRDTYG